MSATKGKQATKGAKQIVEDNKSTLKFYRNMALGCLAGVTLLNVLCFELTTLTVFMLILSTVILLASYQFLAFMSRAQYSETGALLDAGNDLNLTGGVAEEVKDVVILTSGTLLLSLLTRYFWLVLLLAPVRAGWLLWRSIIKPWLSAKNESEPQEVDEKKQRKMERRMKRMQR